MQEPCRSLIEPTGNAVSENDRPMRIPPADPSLSLRVDGGGWTRGWRVGGILRAELVETHGTDGLTLRLEGRLIRAAGRGLPPLVPGTVLRLRVEALGLMPVLKLLLPATEGPAADVAAALRASLPQAGALEPLLERLVAAAARNDPALPAAAAALMETLRGPGELARADTLRTALLDSGLFLEGRLLAGADAAALAGDLKAALWRLLAALESKTGTSRRSGAGFSSPDTAARAGGLRADAEAALARLQLHQIASLPQRQSATHWNLLIPVLGAEPHVVELRIDAEPGDRSQRAPARGWSVLLHLDLPGLGPLQARIRLDAGGVDATLWSERAPTHAAARRHLPQLRERLRAAGLKVRGLECHRGRGPRPAPSLPRTPLVDLEA